jgi:hypothetical protein
MIALAFLAVALVELRSGHEGPAWFFAGAAVFIAAIQLFNVSGFAP